VVCPELDSDAFIYRRTDALFAAEISLGCLYGNVTQEEIGSAPIRRQRCIKAECTCDASAGEPAYQSQLSWLVPLTIVPDRFLGDSGAQRVRPTLFTRRKILPWITPAHASHSSIICLTQSATGTVRTATFSNQINNRPVILPLLQTVEPESYRPHDNAQKGGRSIERNNCLAHPSCSIAPEGTPIFCYGPLEVEIKFKGHWALKAPDAKLLNHEGSAIGRHFAGPTWQVNDGSWVKGRAVAKQVAPDKTAVPWLLLESVAGTRRLAGVRFIQPTGTHGGNAPDGSCSQSAMRRVPYTATYFFYEAGQ
jgi:hypothetical protein